MFLVNPACPAHHESYVGLSRQTVLPSAQGVTTTAPQTQQYEGSKGQGALCRWKNKL